MDIGSLIYISENNTSVLTIFTLTLSTFGLILSIVSLLMLILTALLFQEWRKVYKNQLLIQFMTSRFIFSSLRYILDVIRFCEYDTGLNPIFVYIFSAIYSDMTLVTWMYVFSKHMYDSFVRVCKAESVALWKVSICAWIIPTIIPIFLYCLHCLRNRQDLFVLLVYPMFIKWPVLSVNGLHLVLILKYILNCNQSKTEHNIRIVMVMILLIFTFSIQQAMGDMVMFFYLYIYRNNERVPYMFTLLNISTVYQCGFTILFWLFGNTNTRKLWTFKSDNENLQLPNDGLRDAFNVWPQANNL